MGQIFECADGAIVEVSVHFYCCNTGHEHWWVSRTTAVTLRRHGGVIHDDVWTDKKGTQSNGGCPHCWGTAHYERLTVPTPAAILRREADLAAEMEAESASTWMDTALLRPKGASL